jgi:hypothetical protein
MPTSPWNLPRTSDLALKMQDFAHPWDVVLDPSLRPEQKRAILASWASDAAAVVSRPAFRWLAGTPGPVPLAQVRSALLALDRITPSRPIGRACPAASLAASSDGHPRSA